MVNLVDESDITGTGATLCVLGLCHTLPPNYYETLVAEKGAISTQIRNGDKPLFRLIWQKVAGSQISLLLVQSLDGCNDIRLLGCGLDMLAKTEKAAVILFSTARHALIEQCRTWGAEPFQVWLKKEYPYAK